MTRTEHDTYLSDMLNHLIIILSPSIIKSTQPQLQTSVSELKRANVQVLSTYRIFLRLFLLGPTSLLASAQTGKPCCLLSFTATFFQFVNQFAWLLAGTVYVAALTAFVPNQPDLLFSLQMKMPCKDSGPRSDIIVRVPFLKIIFPSRPKRLIHPGGLLQKNSTQSSIWS